MAPDMSKEINEAPNHWQLIKLLDIWRKSYFHCSFCKRFASLKAHLYAGIDWTGFETQGLWLYLSKDFTLRQRINHYGYFSRCVFNRNWAGIKGWAPLNYKTGRKSQTRYFALLYKVVLPFCGRSQLLVCAWLFVDCELIAMSCCVKQSKVTVALSFKKTSRNQQFVFLHPCLWHYHGRWKGGKGGGKAPLDFESWHFPVKSFSKKIVFLVSSG